MASDQHVGIGSTAVFKFNMWATIRFGGLQTTKNKK